MEQLPEIPINRIWAIQLSNSEYRKWENKEKFGTLYFNWKRYLVPGDLTLRELKKIIGEQLPSEKVSKINSIVKGIYRYSRLNAGDGIFGISSSRKVERIGYVISNLWSDPSKNSVNIKIEWLKGFIPRVAHRNIFDIDLEIEKVNKEIIYQFNLPISIIEESRVYKGRSTKEKLSKNEYLGLLNLTLP
jgi:hypothetical protein